MLDKVFQFFKWAKGVYEGSEALKAIYTVFTVVTAVVGVKGFLQARQMMAKGQDIMANKTAAGGKIPVIYGTRRVGAQIVYMDTAQNRSKDLFVVYAISVGECEEILGRTIEIDGNSILDGNIYKGGGYVGSDKISSGSGSLNTASQVGDNQYSNAGTLGTDPTLRYSFVFNLHHGASSQTADPMLRASIPTEWTTNHKLNGICYIAASFDYDKKGMYKGVPQITVQVKGKKVYDPRTDTTAWSSNPALCFLDYIQNDEYGKGLATSQINMTTISAAANKCDTLVDQPYYNGNYQDVTWSGDSGDDFIVIDDNADWWQNKVDEVIDIRDATDTVIFDGVDIKGSTRYEFYDATQENRLYIDGTLSSTYTNEAGSAKAKVKRFHCNGYIDTNKNVMDNAKELLANMRGILNYVNGKYELQIEDTGTSTFSITDDHIIADAGISVDYGNKDKKANKVVIEFFNANKKYELDTATVLHDATPEYYSDDGEVLEIKAEFPYVTDPYIAYNMGKAILTRSRNQTTMQFLGTPEMYKLNVGDIVDLTYSGLGFSGKICRVEALELQANGLVSVSLIEYFDVYTWEVPAQESVEILAKIPTIGALKPPQASSIVFTDTDASPINRPTLTWTEPTDFPVRQYRVDVVDSSDNNVFSKIVDTPSVDLSFLPKGSNYEASITSFNGVGIESNASTKTFTIADDPVKTSEVEIGSETLSNIIDYGTIAGGGTSNFFQINTRLDLEDRFIWNSNGTNDWSLGTGGDDDVNLYIEGSADKLITFKDQSSELGSVKLTFGDDVSGSYFADFITLEADWTNGYVTTGSGLSKFYIKGKGYDGSTASGTIATFQLTSADGYGIPLTELHGKTKTPILNLDQGSAPSTTTDLLYNVGGTLYWNGSSVNTGAGDITGVTINTSGQSGLTGGASFSSGDATFTLAIASTINGSKTFADDVVIEGDLTVQGTTTTIDTTNLDVADKNITLNYSTGDSSASANGAGITIQDAVSATEDATLTWNTANDSFNFSHPLNVTGNISSSSTVTAASFSASSSGYGTIELGGVSGAYIDLKRPNTDDYDLRLISFGTGGEIDTGSGDLVIKRQGSTRISTTSTGIDVTGTISSGAITSSASITASGNSNNFGNTTIAALSATSGTFSASITASGNSNSFGNSSFGTISSGGITSTGASSIGSGTLHVSATENRVGINTNSHIGTVLNVLDVDDEGVTLRLHTNTNSHNPVLRMNAKNSSGSQQYADIKYNPDSPSLNFHVPYNESTPTLKIADGSITVDGTITSSVNANRFFKYRSGSIADFEVSSDNNSNAVMTVTGTGTADIFKVRDNTNDVFTVKDGGNVGIGRTSVSARLHVQGLYDSATISTSSTPAARINNGGAISLWIGSNAYNYGYVQSIQDDGTNNLKPLSLQPLGGNVGIGETSPSESLTIKKTVTTGDGATALLGVYAQGGAAGEDAEIYIGQSSLRAAKIVAHKKGTGNDHDLSFSTNASAATPTEKMRITSAGRLGLGTDSPTVKLEIQENTNSTDVKLRLRSFNSSSAGRSTYIAYDPNTRIMGFGEGGDEVNIDQNGNLLVGKTASSLFTVGAELTSTGQVYATVSSAPTARFNRKTSDGDIVDFRKDDVTVGTIGTVAGRFYIGNDDTFITFKGSTDTIYPATATGGPRDNAISLGDSGTRFKDLYLSSRTIIGDGSNSAPAYTFGSDADTGMYRVSTNALAFATGGTERWRITSSGTLQGSGTISSGAITTSGYFQLNASHTVYAGAIDTTSTATTSYNVIRFRQGTGSGAPTGLIGTAGSAVGNTAFRSGMNIGTQSSGSLNFIINDGYAGKFDTSGNLLVGKTDLTGNVAGISLRSTGLIVGTVASGTVGYFNRTTSDGTILDFRKDNVAVGSIGVINSNNLTIGSSTSNHSGLQFGTAVITPMRAGAESDAQIDIGFSNARFKDLYLSGTGYFGTSVGIGTTSPSQPLHVDASGGGVVRVTRLGNSASAYGQLEHDGTNTTLTSSAQLIFNSGGSETARLNSSGVLLVGTTDQNVTNNTGNTPGINLGVAGIKGYIAAARYQGAPLALNRLDNDGDIAVFTKNGSTVGSIGTSSSMLYIGNASGLRFDDTVNRILPYNAETPTTTDAVINLGSSGARFKDLYLSGTISSGAITSSGGFTATIGGIHVADGVTFGQGDHFLGDEGGQNDSETLLLRNGASTSGNSGIKILAGYNDGGDTSGKIQLYTNGSTSSPKLEIDIDGNIKMGSTQIISSGRNLTNIGSISATDLLTQNNTTIASLGARDLVTIGSGSRAGAIKINDIAGANYFIAGGGYDLTFYKNVSGTSNTPIMQFVGNNASDNTPDVSINHNLSVGGTITSGAITANHSKSSTANPILTLKNTSTTNEGRYVQFNDNAGVNIGQIGHVDQTESNIFISTFDTGLKFESYITYKAILPCGTDGADVDNIIDLGSSSVRFDDIYATNGTIQTSDRNEKQDIQALTEAEQRVATACKGLIRRFRWQDSVAEKDDNPDSDETARYHFGVIAQDLQDAFTAEGLDAGDYGMFISSTWTDDNGNEQTRLGVRYNELLAFIISTL